MPWKRSEKNPILTRESIPDIHPHVVDPSAVLNPGAIRHGETTLLLLHVQTRGRESHLLRAVSRDGETFKVDSRPCRFFGLEKLAETVHRIYDPRITRLDDRFCVMVALDLDSGCRLGLAVTENFETLEFVGLPAEQDLRNGVLFPERIGGKCLRLERPNRVRLPGGRTTGDQIWLSASDDLVDWEPVGMVLKGRPRHWDELIGSGPPPVRTREGWLHIYHGVAMQPLSGGVYQMGTLLLDLKDPTKVLARSRNNCLEPREPYEVTGRTPNVVFPTGLVVDEFDKEGFAVPTSTVRLYYGAAGNSVALATTTMRDLLAMCLD